jgi:hypothetical protein
MDVKGFRGLRDEEVLPGGALQLHDAGQQRFNRRIVQLRMAERLDGVGPHLRR